MVAPIPEREFLALLKENGCYGKRTGSDDYGIYRESDDRLIEGYAIKHPGPREVKYPYKVKFLRRLKAIQLEEQAASPKPQAKPEAQPAESYRETQWYKDQQKWSDEQSDEQSDD